MPMPVRPAIARRVVVQEVYPANDAGDSSNCSNAVSLGAFALRFDFAFAFVAENRLEVMLVMDVGLGAFKDARNVEREVSAIVGQHETGAIPVAVFRGD